MAEFLLVGQSRAVANTSIGEITLDSIAVNVTTTLKGLQGLRGLTTIGSVDVTGGTSQGINLAIGGNFEGLLSNPITHSIYISFHRQPFKPQIVYWGFM